MIKAQSETFLIESLKIARQINDKASESEILGELANLYARLGRIEEAIAYYHQALEIARAIGDRYTESQVLIKLGQVYEKSGNKKMALQKYDSALSIAREIGGPYIELIERLRKTVTDANV